MSARSYDFADNTADVTDVNVFGFWDDGLRTGFQAGLNHADGTPAPVTGRNPHETIRAAIGLVLDRMTRSALIALTHSSLSARKAR